MKVEFFIEEPVSPLVEGMTFGTDCDFSRIDLWTVRVVGVELRHIAACVDISAFWVFRRHLAPPLVKCQV
jgi:hypothetical protein